MGLPPADRAALADDLLESLVPTDPRIDELWGEEARSRLAAFHAGEIEAIPAEDAFRELKRP